MHYKVNNILIKSENAAKPTSTPSKYMICLLGQYIIKTDTILDYGCGKLRYTIPLSKMAKSVYAVDSKQQIFRQSRINGEKTTVQDLAKRYKNIVLHSVDDKEWSKIKYDKILLSHVLSSIPHEQDRLKIVHTLNQCMHQESILIACTNYRMSYFKKWDISKKLEKYNEGYFIKEPTPSYFGVIDKLKLASYFEQGSFVILKLFIKADNTYCICKKNTSNYS